MFSSQHFPFSAVHGSAASLLSGGSSLYGSAEERQAHEIRRLKRELQDAREQVLSLSSQLSTNVSTQSTVDNSGKPVISTTVICLNNVGRLSRKAHSLESNQY